MNFVFDNAQTVYQASPGYVVREIAGEFLLIPVQMREDAEDQIAVLNETGKFLWERLQDGSTVAGLLQAMMAEYQVSEEEAREDIIAFLTQLGKTNLLMKMEERK